MPNHITNAIIMKNITKLPVFGEYDDSKDSKPELYFDFNKIIPMPDELQVVAGSIENIAVEMAIRLYDKNGDAYKEYHQYSDEDFENRRKNYTESDLELADIGLKYLSTTREATIPITPGCQLSEATTKPAIFSAYLFFSIKS